MPPRGRRRRLRGGLPQGRGRPRPRGGADLRIDSLQGKQVHGRNPLFLAPAKRVLRQPGHRVLLLGAVTVPGPRLAPSAGRGARRCLHRSRNHRLHPRHVAHPRGGRSRLPRQRRPRCPGDVGDVRGHQPRHGHRTHQHPGAEGVSRASTLARPHLGATTSSLITDTGPVLPSPLGKTNWEHPFLPFSLQRCGVVTMIVLIWPCYSPTDNA